MSDTDKLPETQSTPEQTPDTISIPKEKLQEFTQALIKAKDENQKLMNMLNSSVELFGFMKENIFGGEMPKEMTVGMFMKMGTMLMRLKDKLNDDNMKILGEHMDVIRTTAGEFLSEEQVKKISK